MPCIRPTLNHPAPSRPSVAGRGGRVAGRCAALLGISVAGLSLGACAPPSAPGKGAPSADSGAAPADSGGPALNPTAATGSQALATAGGALLAVHPDEGVVSRLWLDAHENDDQEAETGGSEASAIEALRVGGAPSRLAAFGGGWVLSLRGERSLAVLPAAGPLAVIDRVEVGAEPVGLVASRDGRHLYVSLYGADEVLELDHNLELTRRFAAPGRPSWLALHPEGRWLAVGAQLGGALYIIDLEAEAPTAEPLPIAPLSIAFEGAERVLSRRLTGDLAWSEDGGTLAAPLLFVDNTAVPKHTAEEALELDPAYRYERIGLGMSPNNPVVGLWAAGADGRPDPDRVRLINAVGPAPIGPDGALQPVRSYLSGVALSPSGGLALASMEGSGVVVALRVDAEAPTVAEGGLLRAPGAWLASGGEGARGLAFTDENNAWVHHFIDGTAAPLELGSLRGALADEAGGPAMASGSAGPALRLLPPPYDALLDPEVALGRRLFFTGVLPTMTTPLSGVSCGTCHFESRNDGLGWMEVDGIFRQTPSLAGPISQTAPFTWNNDVATVADEVQITSQSRLGGRGATSVEYDAVAAFLEQTPDIDHAHRGDQGAAAQRGRALFEDPQVGCAVCHSGPRFTDQLAHDMYGLSAVDTPSLVGVEATPPYLHDGAAPTLGALLRGLRGGQMGDVSGLSDADLDDLEAYLRSL